MSKFVLFMLELRGI